LGRTVTPSAGRIGRKNGSATNPAETTGGPINLGQFQAHPSAPLISSGTGGQSANPRAAAVNALSSLICDSNRTIACSVVTKRRRARSQVTPKTNNTTPPTTDPVHRIWSGDASSHPADRRYKTTQAPMTANNIETGPSHSNHQPKFTRRRVRAMIRFHARLQDGRV